MKKMTLALLGFLSVFVLHACVVAQNTYSPTKEPTKAETTSISPEMQDHISQYENKLLIFIEAVNSFDPQKMQERYELNTFFYEAITKLSELLSERESIENLELDMQNFLDEKSGFYVKTSSSVNLDNKTYRLVEIANIYGEKIDGSVSSLFLQYWTEDELHFTRLVDSYVTSGESTTLADYRFFEKEKLISIIQLRQIDVFEERDTYNLFLFKLTNDGIIQSVKDENSLNNNIYWQITNRIYSYYNPAREVNALLIFENREESNLGKTGFEYFDLNLIIYNQEAAESRIIIDLKEYFE